MNLIEQHISWAGRHCFQKQVRSLLPELSKIARTATLFRTVGFVLAVLNRTLRGQKLNCLVTNTLIGIGFFLFIYLFRNPIEA
jgi:hypothetical protein